MVKLLTSDSFIIEIEKEIAVKSELLNRVLKYTTVIEPIPINVNFKIMQIIHYFMLTDKHLLKENYNPLEIYFSNDNLSFFEELSSEILLDTCNASNYLEYYFLLELCCKIIANKLQENPESDIAEIMKGKIIKNDDDVIKSACKDYLSFRRKYK